MKDVELEVFRADTRASRGITSKDIADAASAYDPAKAPASICIGHPASDTPSYGTIAKLRAEGSRLFATLADVKDDIVEGIKSKKLINRSMAFFSKKHESNPVPGKLYPRHLGFLGASAPGIPGLSNIKEALSFSADDELEVDGDPAPAILFAAEDEDLDATTVFTVLDKEPHGMDPANKQPTADELKAERAKLDADRAEFNANVEKAAKASTDATVDGLVKEGKLLPADADKAKLIFNALDNEPLEFEAGKEKRSPSAELATLLSGGVKLVPVDETGTKGPEFKAEDKDDPAKIEVAARDLMEKDKSLTFEAAVEQVSTQAKGN